MRGEVLVKQALKWGAGRASLCLSLVRQRTSPPAVILMYHRVALLPARDWTVDSWNVPPAVFDAHMGALAAGADVVSLREFMQRVRADGPRTRPLVTVTFDDGYGALARHAMPVLARWQIPATFFVTTAYVDGVTSMPFDRWATRHPAATDAWRPLTWTEIEHCVDSGLVTVGAHSHQHLPGHQCSAMQMRDEAAQSRAVLLAHLGEAHAFAYAFPYGSRRLGHVPDGYVSAVTTAGFEMALTTDLGVVAQGESSLTLPRIEACAVDSAAVLMAKCHGVLEPLHITEALRRRRRWRDDVAAAAAREGAAYVNAPPS